MSEPPIESVSQRRTDVTAPGEGRGSATTGAHSEGRTEQSERSPDELREDIGELRTELGETVEELAYRVNVPARAREKRDETMARARAKYDETMVKVQQQWVRARDTAAEKGPVLLETLRAKVRQQPALVGGAGAAVVTFLLVLVLRRRRTRHDRVALTVG